MLGFVFEKGKAVAQFPPSCPKLTMQKYNFAELTPRKYRRQ